MTLKTHHSLDDIPLYVGGQTTVAGVEHIVKLSSNENPIGPSPKAVEAYQHTAVRLHRYPQDGALALRQAIEKTHGFKAEQIICGAGSDEIFRALIHAYAGPGDEVLFTEHAFAMYRIYSLQYGATPVAAPESNLTADVDALLARVTDKTKLLFLANPNNPTGTYIPRSEIHSLRAGLRDDVILVLDGAYAEYMLADDFSDGRELVADTNTVLTRTFSKVYGLPSLRLGWGYGPQPIITNLYKVASPFAVSQPAINAAIAALADTDYLNHIVALNNRLHNVLAAGVGALGLTVHPGVANFILIEFPQEAGRTAADANDFLLTRGIIVRMVANYGLPNCLRVSIGSEEETALFLDTLRQWHET